LKKPLPGEKIAGQIPVMPKPAGQSALIFNCLSGFPQCYHSRHLNNVGLLQSRNHETPIAVRNHCLRSKRKPRCAA